MIAIYLTRIVRGSVFLVRKRRKMQDVNIYMFYFKPMENLLICTDRLIVFYLGRTFGKIKLWNPFLMPCTYAVSLMVIVYLVILK